MLFVLDTISKIRLKNFLITCYTVTAGIGFGVLLYLAWAVDQLVMDSRLELLLICGALIFISCFIKFLFNDGLAGSIRSHLGFLQSSLLVSNIALAILILAILRADIQGTKSIGRRDVEFDNTHLVRPWSHAIGTPSAPVTIVEFADFECPVCGKEHPVIKAVIKHYGNNVRFVFRHFPLFQIHPHALEAARASECLDVQRKFWEGVDWFFANQNDLSDTTLKRSAADVGARVQSFDDCLARNTMNSRVAADLADGKSIGVNATPTLFVNREKVVGLISYQSLCTIIDEQLASTKGFLHGTVSQRRLLSFAGRKVAKSPR